MRLLDSKLVQKNKSLIQVININLPIIVIVLISLVFIVFRKFDFQPNEKTTFVFSLSLCALLIGLFFFSKKDGEQNDLEARQFNISNIQSIDKIFLANTKGEKVTLTKEGDIWKVNDLYVARDRRIQTLLKTAKNLEVKQKH